MKNRKDRTNKRKKNVAPVDFGVFKGFIVFRGKRLPLRFPRPLKFKSENVSQSFKILYLESTN